MHLINCLVCDKEVMSGGGPRKYCFDCAKAVKRIAERNFHRRMRVIDPNWNKYKLSKEQLKRKYAMLKARDPDHNRKSYQRRLELNPNHNKDAYVRNKQLDPNRNRRNYIKNLQYNLDYRRKKGKQKAVAYHICKLLNIETGNGRVSAKAHLAYQICKQRNIPLTMESSDE